MENKLLTIVKNSGLDPIQQKPLLDNFGDYFVQAHKLLAKSKGIQVTSESQIWEMTQARELRLSLKKIRVEADKTRVSLKEGYLRGGNAVQSIYNDIRDITEPEEERLREQERFVEIAKEKEKAELVLQRTRELNEFIEDTSTYDLGNLSQGEYITLLAKIKKEYQQKIDEEKRVEQEQEIIRQENEELRKKQAEQEAVLSKVQEEKEKLEREIQLKKEADEKLRLEEEQRVVKEKAEKEELERQKFVAPDKDKMRNIYREIKELSSSIALIPFSTNDCGEIAKETCEELNGVADTIVRKMKSI